MVSVIMACVFMMRVTHVVGMLMPMVPQLGFVQ